VEEEKLGLGRGRASEERAAGRKERRLEGEGVGEEALGERAWRGEKRARKERGEGKGMSSSSRRS